MDPYMDARQSSLNMGGLQFCPPNHTNEPYLGLGLQAKAQAYTLLQAQALALAQAQALALGLQLGLVHRLPLTPRQTDALWHRVLSLSEWRERSYPKRPGASVAELKPSPLSQCCHPKMWILKILKFFPLKRKRVHFQFILVLFLNFKFFGELGHVKIIVSRN